MANDKVLDITKSAEENETAVNNKFLELSQQGGSEIERATSFSGQMTSNKHVGGNSRMSSWAAGDIVNIFNTAYFNNDLGHTSVNTQSGSNHSMFSHGSKVVIGSDGFAYVGAQVNPLTTYDSNNSFGLMCMLTKWSIPNGFNERMENEGSWIFLKLGDPVKVGNDTMYITSGVGLGQLVMIDRDTIRMTESVCLNTQPLDTDIAAPNPNDRYGFIIGGTGGTGGGQYVMSDVQIRANREDTYLVYRDFKISTQTFEEYAHACTFTYPKNGANVTDFFTHTAVLDFCQNYSWTAPDGTTSTIMSSGSDFGNYFWYSLSSTMGYCPRINGTRSFEEKYIASLGMSDIIPNGIIMETADLSAWTFLLYPKFPNGDGKINIKFEASCFVAKGGSSEYCLYYVCRRSTTPMYIACMELQDTPVGKILSWINLNDDTILPNRNEIFCDSTGRKVYIMHSFNDRLETAIEVLNGGIHTMSGGNIDRIASGYHMEYPSVVAHKTNNVIDYYLVSYTRLGIGSNTRQTFVGKFRPFKFNANNSIPTLAKMLETFAPEES